MTLNEMDKIKTKEDKSIVPIIIEIARQCAIYGDAIISVSANSIFAEFPKDNQENN